MQAVGLTWEVLLGQRVKHLKEAWFWNIAQEDVADCTPMLVENFRSFFSTCFAAQDYLHQFWNFGHDVLPLHFCRWIKWHGGLTHFFGLFRCIMSTKGRVPLRVPPVVKRTHEEDL